MSIPVDIENLDEALEEYGKTAYLITTDSQAHPHITHVVLSKEADGFVCGLGRKTSANVIDRPSVALLRPPVTLGGHSLIVDGEMIVVEAEEGRVKGRFEAEAAILHRPAVNEGANTNGNCDSDCRPVKMEEVS